MGRTRDGLRAERLNILFLLTQDLESPSALGRYLPLAQGLARLGHTVRIAALHSDYGSLAGRGDVNHFSYWRGYTVREGEVEVHYVAQMHVHKQASGKSYYSPAKLLLLMARATAALTRAAWTLPADIVHIGKPHPMNSLAGLTAGLLGGRRVLVDCDDYEALSNRFSGAWQRKVIAWFEDGVPRRAHHVTTHSVFLRDRLLALGVPVSRITRVPNGMSRQRFERVDDAQVDALRAQHRLVGKRVVAFVGSLSSPSHPVDLLLDAFVRVQDAEPDSVLLMVGGGEDYDRLRERAVQIGVGHSAVFVGRVPGHQVPAYYCLADVVVDPVYDDPVGQSRVPLKLFESWALGVPFVTGDVGDRAEILGTPPAGVLVRPGDVTALAEGILSVLRRPQDAAAYRRRGLERVSSYDWDHLARKMETVYLRLAAGARD